MTYDAKLSYEEAGYSFTPAEEDQATRYILHDNDWELLKTKTGDKNIDAHIMISQNFNPNHYSKMANNIRNHFEVFSNDGIDTEISYLDFEALVELYQLKRRLYEYLSDGDLKKRFHNLFVDKITSREDGEQYSRFTVDDVEDIDQILTRRAAEYSDERLRHTQNGVVTNEHNTITSPADLRHGGKSTTGSLKPPPHPRTEDQFSQYTHETHLV